MEKFFIKNKQTAVWLLLFMFTWSVAIAAPRIVFVRDGDTANPNSIYSLTRKEVREGWVVRNDGTSSATNWSLKVGVIQLWTGSSWVTVTGASAVLKNNTRFSLAANRETTLTAIFDFAATVGGRYRVYFPMQNASGVELTPLPLGHLYTEFDYCLPPTISISAPANNSTIIRNDGTNIVVSATSNGCSVINYVYSVTYLSSGATTNITFTSNRVNISTLAAGLYEISVVANSAGGASSPKSIRYRICDNPQPVNPLLSASTDRTDGIMVNWGSVLNATTIDILRNGVLLTTVSNANLEYLDNSAAPNVNYNYTAVAKNPCFTSVLSPSVTGRRLCPPQDAVSGFTASDDDPNRIVLNWNAVSSSYGTILYNIFINGTYNTSTTDVQIAIPNVQNGEFCIQAENSCGEKSMQVCDNGELLVCTPVAPTNLTASFNRCDKIVVSWTNPPVANEKLELFDNGVLVADVTGLSSYEDIRPNLQYADIQRYKLVAYQTCGATTNQSSTSVVNGSLAAPVLQVPNGVNFTSWGTDTFIVRANGNWSAVSNNTALVTLTSGSTGVGNLVENSTIEVSKNPSTAQRSTTVTYTLSALRGSVTAIFNISQNGQVMTITPVATTIAAVGGVLNFAVISNTVCTLASADANFNITGVSVIERNGDFTVNIPPNLSTLPRTITAQVTSFNNVIVTPITVTQAAGITPSTNLQLVANEVQAAAGAEVVIPVRVKNIGTNRNIAFQGRLLSSHANLAIQDITSPLNGFVRNLVNGRIAYSNAGSYDLADEELVYNVKVKIATSATVGDVYFINSSNVLAYNSTNFAPINLAIEPIKVTVINPNFNLVVKTKTVQGYSVEANIKVTEVGNASNTATQTTALANGNTTFSLAANKTYKIEATKTANDMLCGVNVQSIAMCQSHILGISNFNFYQRLALDVSGDGEITVLDIALLQAAILGNPLPDFANFGFVFVPEGNYDAIENTNDVAQYTEILLDAQKNLDLIAIKKGSGMSTCIGVAGGKQEIPTVLFAEKSIDEQNTELVALEDFEATGIELVANYVDNFTSVLPLQNANFKLRNQQLKIAFADGKVIQIKKGDVIATVQHSANKVVNFEGLLVDKQFALASIVAQKQQRELQLFPNPATSHLSLHGLEVGSEISLINSLGVVVLNSKANNQSFELSVENLPRGLYIAQITNNGRVTTKKVVLE